MSPTGSHGSTKRTTIPRPRNPRIVAYNMGSGGDKTRTVSPAVSPSAEARDWAPAESVPISPNEAHPSFSVHTAGEVARSRKWLSTRFVQFIRWSSGHRGCILWVAAPDLQEYYGSALVLPIPILTYERQSTPKLGVWGSLLVQKTPSSVHHPASPPMNSPSPRVPTNLS